MSLLSFCGLVSFGCSSSSTSSTPGAVTDGGTSTAGDASGGGQTGLTKEVVEPKWDNNVAANPNYKAISAADARTMLLADGYTFKTTPRQARTTCSSA